MGTTVYYSPKGKAHTVSTDYTPGGYEVRLDGKIYAMADDRAELSETVRELVKRKRFSETPPKSGKKLLRPCRQADSGVTNGFRTSLKLS